MMKDDYKEEKIYSPEEMLFDRISKGIEGVRKIQNEIKGFLKGKIDLNNRDNVYIQFNNKVGEIGRDFKEKGIDFYKDSALKNPIIYKLDRICLEGIDSLLNFANEFGEKLGDKKAPSVKYVKSVIESANKHLEEYRKYGDAIYNFDIEKEIVGAVTEYYEYCNGRGEWEYEKELKALGYEKLIPELKKSLKEKGYDSKEER